MQHFPDYKLIRQRFGASHGGCPNVMPHVLNHFDGGERFSKLDRRKGVAVTQQRMDAKRAECTVQENLKQSVEEQIILSIGKESTPKRPGQLGRLQ